ncbi:PadR family transcriptional regulator [Nocardia abscessus]|uniref:PadR family transcriptional regulator n=1 Tax=Nocardia TaxID=1817 RepID=UPI0018932B61|nr:MULTISPECIES: PadR family transcriptional regulator [Nocardia]MBF6222653.1 PadR family transcriptional regulator [Nocardia abscessus]MDE1671175.1 PadR family transcriptional regulator [Nocardia gipuzkoensis]UGT69575.1 PadR family transcriptional regulator [Nocardia gipuzkoensis]
MALEHALLVSLTERAGSGYELARRFDKSIGYFWSATHQQIYRVLKRMEESGWVDGESVTQEGRPDKKVYSVSAAGRGELARWIAEPSDSGTPRNELAVKIRAAAYGDITALRAEVARHRDQHAQRLELYRHIEKRDFPAPDRLGGTALHQYLVLRAGIRVESGFVEWCDEVLHALHPRATAPHAD